jgi:hypothetical protein
MISFIQTTPGPLCFFSVKAARKFLSICQKTA